MPDKKLVIPPPPNAMQLNPNFVPAPSVMPANAVATSTSAGFVPPPPPSPPMQDQTMSDDQFIASLKGDQQTAVNSSPAPEDRMSDEDFIASLKANQPAAPGTKKKETIAAAINELKKPNAAALPAALPQSPQPANPVSPTGQVLGNLGFNLKNLGKAPSLQGLKHGADQHNAILTNVVKGAQQLGSEVAKSPLDAGLAALTNMIPGAVSLPQDAVNLAQYAGNAINPVTKMLSTLGLPNSLGPAHGFQDLAGGLGSINKMMGRPEQAPVRVKEVLEKPLQPYIQHMPASSGAGQLAGAMFGPAVAEGAAKLAAPQALKAWLAGSKGGVPIAQLLAPEIAAKISGVTNKFAQGAIQGAQAGAGYAGFSDLAQQATTQAHNNQINPASLNLKQVGDAAAQGAGPGALLGTAGALFHPNAAPAKVAEPQPEPAPPAPEAPPQPADQAAAVQQTTKPEYVNPFDGLPKSNLKKFEATLSKEFESVGHEDAHQLESDALAWIKKNVNGEVPIKAQRDKVSKAREGAENRHLDMLDQQRKAAAEQSPQTQNLTPEPQAPVENQPATEEPKKLDVKQLIEQIPHVSDDELVNHHQEIAKGLGKLESGYFKNSLKDRMDELSKQRDLKQRADALQNKIAARPAEPVRSGGNATEAVFSKPDFTETPEEEAKRLDANRIRLGEKNQFPRAFEPMTEKGRVNAQIPALQDLPTSELENMRDVFHARISKGFKAIGDEQNAGRVADELARRAFRTHKGQEQDWPAEAAAATKAEPEGTQITYQDEKYTLTGERADEYNKLNARFKAAQEEYRRAPSRNNQYEGKQAKSLGMRLHALKGKLIDQEKASTVVPPPEPTPDFSAMDHTALEKWGEDHAEALKKDQHLMDQWHQQYISKYSEAFLEAQEAAPVEPEPAAKPPTQPEDVSEAEQKKAIYDIRKSGKGREVYNVETGEVARKGNYSEADMRHIADRLNAEGKTSNRGRRTDIDRSKERSAEIEGYQKGIIENGRNLEEIEEKLSPEENESLKSLAQNKIMLEQARAEHKNILAGASKRLEKPLLIKTVKTRRFSPEFEALIRKAALEDERPDNNFSVEVNSDHNPPIEPTDFSGLTPEETMTKALDSDDRLKQAEKAYRMEREKHVASVVPTLRRAGEPSVNIDHDGSTVNVRLSPKAELMKEAGPTIQTAERSVTDYNADSIAKKAKAKAKQRGGRSQSGSADPLAIFRNKQLSASPTPMLKKNVMDLKKPAPEQPATVEDKIAESFAQGEEKIPFVKQMLKDGAERIRPFVSTRRSFDILQNYDNGLHNRLYWNIAKEARFAEGIEFKPEDAKAVNDTLKLSPEEILAGEGEAAKFDDKQRFFLAQRKELRKQSAQQIKKAMDDLETQHGKDRDEMPRNVQDVYDTLDSIHRGLTGTTGGGERSRLGDEVNNFVGTMYDYVFKWNPSYHALNLTDPLIMGSSRAGIDNILQAKYMLNPINGDPVVRKYIASVADRLEGPIATMRKEHRLSLKAGDSFVAKLRSLPDFKSVEWNNRDIFLAAVLKHAKDTGRDPIQFARDMAEGKLSDEDKIHAYVEAMKINQDVNGSGTFGLDKDVFQRTPALKSIVQFVSQPYRVTRMMKQWLIQGSKGDRDALRSLATFVTVSTALGGKAVIPKELMIALKASSPQNEEWGNHIDDFLDHLSIPRLFGRDISDKLALSLVPLLSGTSRNFAIDDLFKRWDQARKSADRGEYDKVAKTWLPLALSGAIGGAGGFMTKLWSAAQNVPAGKRKYSLYQQQSESPTPGGSDKPDGSITLPYDFGRAAGDVFLPGERTEIADKRKQIRDVKTRKRNLLNLKKDRS